MPASKLHSSLITPTEHGDRYTVPIEFSTAIKARGRIGTQHLWSIKGGAVYQLYDVVHYRFALKNESRCASYVDSETHRSRFVSWAQPASIISIAYKSETGNGNDVTLDDRRAPEVGDVYSGSHLCRRRCQRRTFAQLRWVVPPYSF